MNEVETFKHEGMTVRICYDEDPIDPTKDYDQLTHMVCWHRRANLGHETVAWPMSAKEVIRRARSRGEKIIAMLPLYLYEHSGWTISTGPFGCMWDSGQVGWAYVTKSSAEKMGCVGIHYSHEGGNYVEDGTWDKARLEDAIREDVALYDQYLQGECYGFIVEDKDRDEVDDGWGFLGNLEGCREEAKIAAEHTAEKDRKARKRFTKSKWRGAVRRRETEDGYETWLKGMKE